MIDWARIDELRSEVGEDAFGEVLDLFLEEVDEVIARLPQTTDPETLAGELHFVRGSALNLGLRDFCGLCRDIEDRLAGGQPVELGPLVTCYAESKDCLLDRIQTGRNVA
ncbi:Hpt domain-containing protein [Rhodovulum sp. P5]|uniref:Hpt domain-containing protein n=1 Tax=Rhodovulum sp. P5 TaxID=1564506 RepID=UPI0009D9ACF4|nr:Hpt domain-containing protein [Rhodovulum sp. P5]